MGGVVDAVGDVFGGAADLVGDVVEDTITLGCGAFIASEPFKATTVTPTVTLTTTRKIHINMDRNFG